MLKDIIVCCVLFLTVKYCLAWTWLASCCIVVHVGAVAACDVEAG